MWDTPAGEHLITDLCLSREHGTAEEAPLPRSLADKLLQREVTVVVMF